MVVKKPPSIVALDDFDESINGLIYGDSGVGKTVFGGSADGVLFVGTESGTISAKRQGSTADVWNVEEWTDVYANYQWLKGGGAAEYKWVVMDSGTAMQHIALRHILDTAVAENSSRDPDIPAIQDHQKWQNMFKRFVKSYCDLPVNVLFTATTTRHEDEEGEDIVLPDFAGKGYGISQWVCAQMHFVGYMKVMRRGKGDEKELWRRIQFQTIPPYFGKDRYACLGTYNDKGVAVKPYLDNVTLQQVTDLIASSGAKVTASASERAAVGDQAKTRVRRTTTTRRRPTA